MPRFHPSARFLNYRRTYFPNFAETIRNEEQFKISVTVPYLESLSYQRADIEFERRIDVQIGTRTHSVQADIVINIEGCPFVVIDTKTPSERVTETDVLQALSYAKLISTPPAAVGIAINGYECSGVNVITGARLNDVPTRDEASELFRLHRPRPLSEIVLQETKRILNTIDNREELYRVIRECKILIERQGGIRNDISFREMTKLLLVKMAEERRAQFELTNRFSDTYLTQFAGANDISYSAAMERLFSEVTAQYPNIYSTGERLRISDDTVMSGIVLRLENFSFTGTGDNIKGAVYEIFLKSQLRGELDQYFTPREIVEFMTSLADPNIGERVLDAACGSGGFLIHAFRHVKQKIDDSNAPDHTKQEQNDDLIAERLWGVEIDEDLHTLAKINLIMHGDGYNHIIRGDGLSTEYLPEDFFDVVLMNPPFTTQYANRSVLDRYILGQGRTAQELDILFVERAVRSLRPGGRLLIVLPEGMLNLPSYGEFREWLITNCDLTHTISLPEGTFQPFGNSASKTCILGVWKKSEDDAVPTTIFAAQARNIGFEPGKRDYRRTDRNDLVRFVDVHERIEPFVGNEDREFQAVIADRAGAPRERFDAGAQLNAYEVRNLTVFRRARFVPLNANVVSVRGTERLPNREVLYFQADWVAPGTGVIQSVEFRSRQGRYNRLSAGDVFLVSINPKLNRVVLIPGAVDEIWTTNEGHVLELNPGGPIVHPGYLCAALRADYVVRQMVRLATGSSSSRARLSDHDFCQIMVPVIDEADQIRIGSELVAAIDASWTASLRLRSALEATDRLVAFLK